MRRIAIVALLFSGYAGYYFARANLSATAPLLIAYLHAHGASIAVATLEIGALATAGTLAYAFGKFFLTWCGDVVGGKPSFLAGMFGAIVFTVMFAFGSYPLMMTAWIGNRLSQSIGWAALVKVVSRWFPAAAYGSVMAVLSLSFLVGDAVTRGGIAALIGAGFDWEVIFLIVAGALTVLFLLNLFFLKESSGAQENLRPTSVRGLLGPLLRKPAFWVVCAMSFGTTLLRETIAVWTPTYFTTLGFSPARAAGFSALGPLTSIVAVLAAGWLSDRLGTGGRARISFVGMALAAGSLGALALLPAGAAMEAVALVVLVGFFNSGPYSYLAGAMALDFGGSTAASVSSGLIDGVGYLGGALAGVGIAQLELAIGWGGAFGTLAIVSAVTAVLALLLLKFE